MKEQLITFETAKLAKEKNFFIETKYYCQKSSIIGDNTILGPLNDPNGWSEDWNNFSNDVPYYSMPTQPLLQKWLREEHGIFVYVSPKTTQYIVRWCYNLLHTGKHVLVVDKYGVYPNTKDKTYEEALEQGLVEGLKLIEI